MEIRGKKDYIQENQTIEVGLKCEMKEKTEETLRKSPDSIKKVHC